MEREGALELLRAPPRLLPVDCGLDSESLGPQQQVLVARVAMGDEAETALAKLGGELRERDDFRADRQAGALGRGSVGQ
jgi:hypothetical protein